MSTTLTSAQLISNRLNPMLGSLQRLQADNHIGRIISNTGGQITFSMPFGNWLTGATIPASPTGYPIFQQVDSGGSRIVVPASYDPVGGTVTINSTETGVDMYCSYYFNYFSQSDLGYFYLLAMAYLNNLPPVSYFFLDDVVQGQSTPNYPADMEHFLTMYAYKLCISALMGDLMTKNARLIFTNLQDFSQFLQSKVSEFDTYISSNRMTIKSRRFLSAKSVSAGRYGVPATVTDTNFAMYSSIRSR